MSRSTATTSAAFWLAGWHRLIHKWDCYVHGHTLTTGERTKRGSIAKKFTMAEWRFHEAQKKDT